MEIEIGKRVIASTGKHVGNVDHIVLHSQTKQLVLFVVRQGLLLTKDRMIEPEHVSSIDSDGTIRLDIDEVCVDELPEFIPARYRPSIREDVWMKDVNIGSTGTLIAPIMYAYKRPTGADASNLPPNTVLLDHDSKVYDHDGNEIGSIEDVTYDADGSLVSIEVRTGIIEHCQYIVAKSDIASISRWRIVLKSSKEQVERS